ncbi:hypothetical protein ACFVHR_04540 [Streptomyces sp. NPDC127168]|uniref:hypothetical protein n=1 Tax=Streptomyces sp. NPDC127168 TaxID=3345381 RepID=UPI00362D0847
MNTRRVNSATGVILAALQQGRVPAGIALALESAGLLMTPETANDMASVSAEAVALSEKAVAELRWEHAENARLRERIAELEAGPVLPWAQTMSEHDLHGFLDQLLSAAMGRWQHSPEVPDRVTLAEIEKVFALWRTPGEGNRLDGSEFDGAVIQLAPQALRKDESPLRGRALLDELTVERAEAAHAKRLGIKAACCHLHKPDCCDPEDCGPCCMKCPTCPTLARQRDVEAPEQGACTECGDGPSKWCAGCAKCSCVAEHDKGCAYASAPR